jgi:hypothetical protein
MKMKYGATTVLISFLSLLSTAHAGPAKTLFDQSFSIPDSAAGDYVHATAPSKNQFTRIDTNNSGTWSVSGGRLSLAKTSSGNANIGRAVDMEGSPTQVLSFSVDLDFSFAVPEGTRLLTGSIGSDTTNDGNWLTYGLDAADGENTWVVVGDRTRTTFSGLQTLTVILNDSDGEITYTAPDGNSVVLSPDKWDLWVGKKRVLAGKSAANAELMPAQFTLGIYRDADKGIFAFDNVLVQSLSE